jgi:cell division protein FtsI (penicillin-binding protein 3)/stage V sporulation protein D (sporulation-specific penicillin-binding protein)
MKTVPLSVWRIRLLSAGICFVALLFIGRLFMLQVVQAEKYRDRAKEQYVNTAGTLYDRGSIFFKRKDGELISAAGIKTGSLLVIDPSKVKNAEELYTALSAITPLEKEDFLKRATKQDDRYEEVARRVDEKSALKIKALKRPEVSLYEERWRYYPGGTLAANTLGFVGHTENGFSGQYGLENFYNDVLERNQNGLYNNFFVEVFSGIKSFVSTKNIAREADIVLTIEPVVQSSVEDVLEKFTTTRAPREAGIIVLDPTTGEIMAMATTPTYNPNEYSKEEDLRAFSNPLISGVYEMGSIVKPLTVAAGLDAGVISEGTTYNDEGFLNIDDRTIYNFDKKGRGVVNMQAVLNDSLNTGVVFIMRKLGAEKFKEYFTQFGLDQKTLVDLPEEGQGDIENLNSGREINLATASFGQGIAVTPVNMTRALASLANGGYLIRPHVVSSIDYKGFPPKKINTEESGRVFSEDTSRRITAMLVNVVDKALLQGSVSMPRYSIAAKTGTAQISNPNGGYYTDRYLHSFFGYFPAYKPRFLVFLYAVNPQNADYASQTLTMPFMDITRFLLNYYEIPPDR